MASDTRQLPNDLEAEQAVLAACLLDEDACYEVSISLREDQFFKPSHRMVFGAIQEMARAGMHADVISLADKLQASGRLEDVGGKSFLVDLNGNTYALTNWRHHVQIVRRTAIQRELIKAAAQINALAYDPPEDLNEVVGEAEQTLFSVTEKKVQSGFQSMGSLVESVLEELNEIANSGSEITGVSTGFKDVDNLFHGLRGGDLVILAARPGVGKTAFALNLAVEAAKRGTEVVFFSLEMSASQLTKRIIGSEARVSLHKMQSGKMAKGEWDALIGACSRLDGISLQIDDTPGLTIMEARAKARRQLRDIIGTDKNGLIIIDYLQLMEPSIKRRDSNRAVEVGEISRGLKILAKELDMPVIALSQLNRSVEVRGGKKRPMLSDLRESGSIEQDADIVMFIDRSMDEAEAEDEKRPDFGMATLIVAKHRNGPTADINLSFNPEHTKFGDYYDDSHL